MNKRLQKWIKWLEIIKAEVYQMVLYKDIFWNVQKLIKSNPAIQKHSSFYDFLSVTYVSYIIMAIRRQIKISQQSISFARFLSEIIATPEILSRKYYVSLYRGSVVEPFADNHFDRLCGKGASHIQSQMVLSDLSSLKLLATKCEEFADKRIAHRDTRNPKTLPVFNEIDKCIEELDKLYVKYNNIFHANSMNSLMPVYQYDWQEIFDKPWRIKIKKR